MNDGYENFGESDFSDLDEWLCEYVDGTIDPVVREALEEYMQANPELAAHVERLRETRHLLCHYGCQHKAPRELQPRLRRLLACEIVQESEPFLARYSPYLTTLATLSSFAAMLLLVVTTTYPAEVATFLTSTQIEAEATLQKPVHRSSDLHSFQRSELIPPLWRTSPHSASSAGQFTLTPLRVGSNSDTLGALSHTYSTASTP